MGNLTEKTISKEQIYNGKIIDLYVEEVELPNKKVGKREIVKHPGAVAVLAVTDEGNILMVEQFRKPLEKTIIEIPAGKLEKGENPLECAKRELLEETGYSCEKMESIGSFYTSPGFADELIHLFFTDSLIKIGDQMTDEDEFLNVMEVSVDEAKQLVRDERIHDAKTAYGVMYMELAHATSR
ncbi:NUDIX hydrolase [Fictibacillus phosphorivorans]|uniref:NUDIX hydrolase n=1 Tax=Fictibacillus phosphorivorans TaxID=1221500 RepID=UPI002040D3DC|nr:NUDIX hydrolase [Fictibacillus phosphorivorans]MCM3719678.1 NUDIX hydrolase [Fictibacillus phosphorivorans]MCM3777369.1 NUDIX hydrolase [Fictibacillus phosphorivorans]